MKFKSIILFVTIMGTINYATVTPVDGIRNTIDSLFVSSSNSPVRNYDVRNALDTSVVRFSDTLINRGKGNYTICYFDSTSTWPIPYIGNQGEKLTIDKNTNFLHRLEVMRPSDCCLLNYGATLFSAANYYNTNMQINYVPLIISNILYQPLNYQKKLINQNCTYFSVLPFKGSSSSQLVTFGYKSDFSITNDPSKSITNIKLTIEGNTYQMGLNDYAPVAFSGPGTFLVNVEVTYSTGVKKYSSFDFCVNKMSDSTWFNSNIENSRASFGNSPDGIKNIIIQEQYTIDGEDFWVTYDVRKAWYVEIKKPVIFVQPYDGNFGTENQFTLDSMVEFGLKTGIDKDLITRGYTPIYLHLDNNWSDLKKQAYGVMLAMQYIWYHSDQREPIKLVGFSMGGIVATLASGLKNYYASNPGAKEAWENNICWYEHNNYNVLGNINYKLNLTLTWDSPHLGALMPSSIYEFSSFFRRTSDAARQGYDALVNKACNEMFTLTFPDQTDNSWINQVYKPYLAYIKSNKNPSTTKFVAITQGSWNGTKQYPDPTYQTAEYAIVKAYEFAGYWIGIKMQMWSHPGDGCHTIFYGNMDEGYLGQNGRILTIGLALGPQMDEFRPGSNRNTYESIYNGLMKTVADNGYNPSGSYLSIGNHCFVPTYSAAAILENVDPTSKLDYNLDAKEITLGKKMEEYSPFHKIYKNYGANQAHVLGWDAENMSWLKNEIYQATLSNRTINIINGLLLLD